MNVFIGCNKQGDGDVRVTTYTPQEITQTSAKCGGDVIVTQGLSLTEFGVCWSKERNPTAECPRLSTTNWSEPYVCILTGLEPGTKYHVRAYALRGLEYYYGDDISFTTSGSGGGGGGLNGHAYVDLGLPSGTLWATYNVGAENPESFGDYFAWGETKPKTVYNWSTYKYCMGVENTLTKYCNNSNYGYNGFMDDLTVLQPSDDAATANWGNDWCMPTKEQWQELRDNTTSTWIMQNSIKGWLFTARNGCSLFLPAVGAGCVDDNTYGIGECGYYWSSSLNTDYPYSVLRPDFAWAFGFSDIIYDGIYGERGMGKVVRAVRSSRKIKE